MTYQRVTGALTPGGHPGSYNGQDAYNDMLITGEIHETMGRNADGSDAVCKKRRGGQRMPDKMNFNAVMDDTARTLTTQKKERPTTMHTVVRRLTPLECERLQGFPDKWTDIGEWYDSKGKKHKEADSPRYKALGNSIAIPFWEWMAGRICAMYDRPVLLGSLFDGIGGFPLAFSRHGAVPVWASEIEEFPIAVTKKHFPEEEIT